jgi:hypothetical protein
MLCVGVLGVLSLSMLTSGCSNAPEPAGYAAGTGKVDVALTAQSDGVKYRLQNAKFTITGETLNLTRVIMPPADLPIDQETLPAGKYSILLADGWQLEAEGPGETSFSAVDAELAVNNPLDFTVTRNKTVQVVFAFISRGKPINLNNGRANVRISVSDCSQYDTYAATIAGLTVQCLGRIDQYSYLIDDSGFLARNFTDCAGEPGPLLDAIDGLLGLQYPDGDAIPFVPDNPLAFAQDCIAGRWAEWREAFDANGTTECPDWGSGQVQNPPTLELYQRRIFPAEPKLPFVEDGTVPDVLALTKINSLYNVSFAGQNPDQQCGSPGNCATACAGGFPGFIVQQEGDAITTDPPAWLDATAYPNGDPYGPNYYHMMSFYGPLPGALFGVIQRADPTLPKAEQCSVYISGTHQPGTLQPNCRTAPDGTPACASLCTPRTP